MGLLDADYDESTAPARLRGLYRDLAPDPNADYGTLLPFARDRTTGEKRWALPSLLRDGLLGGLDLAAGTETGDVTPRAAATLLSASPAGAASAPRGATFGIFGGTGAKTMDRRALHDAMHLERTGAYPDDIWRETGWMKGPDGKWRFEINDADATYRPGGARSKIIEEGVSPEHLQKHGFEIELPDILNHPELYKAYPELEKTIFQAMPPGGLPEGVAGRKTGNLLQVSDEYVPRLESGKSILLHEVQHRIQDLEHFARGGQAGDAAAMALPAGWRTADQTAAYIAKEIKSGWGRDSAYIKGLLSETDPATAEHALALAKIHDLDFLRQLTPDPRLEGYRRLAGETEARNVQTRMSYSPTKRRDLGPEFTQDYPASQQIVRGPGFSEYNPFGLLNR